MARRSGPRAPCTQISCSSSRTGAPGEGQPRSFGLSTFLVDLREAPEEQLRIQPIQTMINHNTTEIFLDNLVIPAENRIGEEGRVFETSWTP